MKSPTVKPLNGHQIKCETHDGLWFATLIIQTSRDEYSPPYNLETPSQTLLLELIRVIFGKELRK